MHSSIELRARVDLASPRAFNAKLPIAGFGYTLDYCEASRAHYGCIEMEIQRSPDRGHPRRE